MYQTRAGAGIALLACLAGCVSTPAPVPTDAPQEAGESAPASAAEPALLNRDIPAPAARRIRIAAVGDIMLGTDYPENHLPDDDGVGFLSAVTDVLQAADLTFGNLEGVLVDGGEPAKQCSNPRACYLFRSPERYAAHLANAGFDVLSLANNHARDFGEEGRTTTMQALAAHGMHHTGREGDIARLDAAGLQVAVIAFAVTRGSYSMLDIVAAAHTVADLAVTHDIVIVSFHGGAEGLDARRLPFAEETYYNEPRGDVVLFARSMVDSGADLVIGHGPHVVRGMERYADRLIAYSLGNFATYYGISVAGLKGVAPILSVTLDGEGRFLSGQLTATHQLRPGGPVPDPSGRAIDEVRALSLADFATPGIRIDAEGGIAPDPRSAIAGDYTPADD